MTATITIKLGLKASSVVDLPGLGTSGYSWVYDPPKETVVEISHQYIVPPPIPNRANAASSVLLSPASGSVPA